MVIWALGKNIIFNGKWMKAKQIHLEYEYENHRTILGKQWCHQVARRDMPIFILSPQMITTNKCKWKLEVTYSCLCSKRINERVRQEYHVRLATQLLIIDEVTARGNSKLQCPAVTGKNGNLFCGCIDWSFISWYQHLGFFRTGSQPAFFSWEILQFSFQKMKEISFTVVTGIWPGWLHSIPASVGSLVSGLCSSKPPELGTQIKRFTLLLSLLWEVGLV